MLFEFEETPTHPPPPPTPSPPQTIPGIKLPDLMGGGRDLKNNSLHTTIFHGDLSRNTAFSPFFEWHIAKMESGFPGGIGENGDILFNVLEGEEWGWLLLWFVISIYSHTGLKSALIYCFRGLILNLRRKRGVVVYGCGCRLVKIVLFVFQISFYEIWESEWSCRRIK